MHVFPNGKRYIGITSKELLCERFRNGSGYHRCPYMINAIKRYGWDNIEHIVLFTDLSKEEAEEREIQLIQEYKTNEKAYGYNLAKGGETSNGYKHTKEQIEKAQRNRHKAVYSKETRRKMSEKYRSLWRDPEYKEKMLTAFSKRPKKPKGFKLSEETKQKISETRNVKYIRCIETGEVFRGTRDCAEKHQIDRRTLQRILNKEKGFNSVKKKHYEYVIQ